MFIDSFPDFYLEKSPIAVAQPPKPYPEPKISVPRFCEEEGFYTTPQRTSTMSKIERNRLRDREINHYYLSKGWTALRFWDFEVKKELGMCVKRVVDALSG